MRRKKVLVVDDEEIIRKVIKACLVKSDYKVKEAANGAQALEALDREDFDLLILDILMPMKNGWQVLLDLRSNPKTKDMPVIVLTGKNEDADMFKGYELGASYYVAKPFSKAQLLYGLQLMFTKDSPAINYSPISW